MKRPFCFFLIGFTLQVSSLLWAQAPIADFTIPTSACLSQSINFQNNSTGATTYTWDFCFDDLNQTNGVSSVAQIAASLTPTSITMAYDQGNWYGFMSSRDNNKIFRIDFGNSIENPTPTVTDLGNISSVLNGPKTLRFVQEAGVWYAIGVNNTTGYLFRLTFGASLNNNSPTGQSLGNLSTGGGSEGMDFVFDGTNWIAIVTSYSASKVSLVNFGNSVLSNPTLGDVLTIVNGTISNPYGVKLFNDSGQWYGLVGSYTTNVVTRLKFGVNLFSIPAFDDIYSTPTHTTALSIQKEGLNYYGFVATLSGELHRLSFGNSLNNSLASSTNLGTFGTLSSVEGFDLVRATPFWYGFFINYNTKTVYRLKFQSNCTNVPVQYSTLANPTLTYPQAGNFPVELTAYGSNGNASAISKTVVIQNNTAPDIDFTINNSVCLGAQNTFNAVSIAGGIQNYTWSFGDGGTATSTPTNYTYSSTGNYPVTLVITGTNGCTNSATKSLSIYNPPSPDFNLPTGTLCTNQSLLFTNTTISDVGSNPTWNWFVDGVLKATTKDLSQSFSSVSSYSIKLVAKIAGCQNQTTKTLGSLSTGPSVDYSYTNNCYQQAIQFTNLTTGSGITAQTWNFGDGGSQTSLNASHVFVSAGNYDVKLTVDNATGCSSTKIINIPVNDQPLIDFSYTNPIENQPVTFTGQDLTLSDDVVTNWTWDFNGTSSNANPSQYTFSSPVSYLVKLSVITQQGCNFEVQKMVAVKQATKPNASFSMSNTGCLNGQLDLTNTTINGANYTWDLCFSDLTQTNGISSIAQIATSLTPTSITMAYDQGNWYGFMSSRDNNKLFRLDFGSSIENPSPTVTDLGNISAIFNGPKAIRFVQEAGVWYGIGVNNTTGYLFRLTFGTSLNNNSPTGQSLGNLGTGGGSEGMDFVFDGTNWIAIVTSYSTSKVSLVNFGSSVLTNPVIGNVLTIATGTINNPYGVKLFNDSGQWYGLVGSYTGLKITRLKFGATLFSTPTFDDIYSTPVQPTALSIQKEGLNYYAFISTLSGELHRLSFGNSLNNSLTSSSNLGTFGTLASTEGFDLVRASPLWYGFFINYNTKTVYRLKFQGNCANVPAQFSTLANPNLIYSQAGNFFIELTAYSSNGNLDIASKSFAILNQTAPDIDFTTNGQCIGSASSFTATSIAGGIQNYAWVFGNSGATAVSNPTSYTYPSVGNYNVKLTINGTNGCKNSISKFISIYNPPTPNFTLPTNNPLCTNQQFTFPNTSTYDVGSSPTWEWLVDGVSVSSIKDLQYAFTSAFSPTIKLKATIPGCTTESSQPLTALLAGPQVSFTISGYCENDILTLTNNTTDPVASYLWTFGDGQTSTSNNSQLLHTYTTHGNYSVSLQGNSANGCQNTATKNITIYTKPQADFSLALPPFSCSGSPSQFNDLTPNPVDSNISQWSWNFNDTSSGQNFSTDQNPLHTYLKGGDYNVSLTATTDYGCSSSIQKQVTISQSPVADFTNTPLCKNLPVNFSDVSGSNIKSWSWQMENTFYFIKNPTHVFTVPGSYSIDLIVTANNNCISFINKTLIVPIPLLPDFSIQKNCVGQNTVFTDLTDDSNDHITNQDWNFGTLATGAGSPSTSTFAETGSFIVKMKVSTQSGCTYSASKNVTITSAPVSAFAASPDVGIPPLTVRFTNTSTNASNFLWEFHDSKNSTSQTPSPSFTFQDPGEYVVDLTAFNSVGCSTIFSKIIKAILPVYDIAITAITVEKNKDGSLKVVANLKNNGNVTLENFPIILDLSGFTSIREIVTVPLTARGTYNYVFSNEILNPSKLGFLCADIEIENDITAENNRLCSSLNDKTFVYEPYPNPANDELVIDWITNDSDKVSIALIDSMGKLVSFTTLDTVSGFNSIKLQTETLNNGLYVLKLNSSTLKIVKKIAITH